MKHLNSKPNIGHRPWSFGCSNGSWSLGLQAGRHMMICPHSRTMFVSHFQHNKLSPKRWQSATFRSFTTRNDQHNSLDSSVQRCKQHWGCGDSTSRFLRWSLEGLICCKNLSDRFWLWGRWASEGASSFEVL